MQADCYDLLKEISITIKGWSLRKLTYTSKVELVNYTFMGIHAC